MINNRQRSQSMAELAATMGSAISALSLERFSLWGISFGGKLALSLAVQAPERLEALVLAAPAAIRAASGTLPSPADLPALLHAHPERRLDATPLPREVDAKQRERLLYP